ncbi:hypothetical protein ACTFIU_003602 [Dictyostelium citrinum]
MYKLSDPFDYNIDSNYANNQPNEFWDEIAKKYVYWNKIYDKVYSGDEIYPDWFNGGKLNTCYNVLDIHVNNPFKRDQIAIIYECPYLNKSIELTFYQLYEKVCEFSRVLLNLNISKNDNVLIYMASTLEPLIALLSCTRIGATYCPLFYNHSVGSLVDRIETITPKLILTSNYCIINDEIIDLTSNLKKAIELSNHKPNHIITHFRNNHGITNEKDLKFIESIEPISNTLNWQVEINKIKENQQESFYEYVPVDSNHPLYIIYTSGTTGKPKSIVRGNGSHLVCLKYHYSALLLGRGVLTFFCHTGMGSLTLHSFLFGYLSFGHRFIMYEGELRKLEHMEDTFWKTIEKHKVSVAFTGPQTFRHLMKTDPNAEKLHSKYNLSSLVAIGIGREVIEESVSEYIENKIKVKCSRGYGQSEIAITLLLTYGHVKIPYHSSGLPSVFLKPTILSPDDGKELNENEIGEISFKLPMPPSFATTFYKNDEKFKQLFKKYKGYYNSGDLGYKDKNGCITVISRLDEQTLINGKSYSLIKIDISILKHPLVLECCSLVYNPQNQMSEQLPIALLVLKNHQNLSIDPNQLKTEINLIISNDIDPSISLRKIVVVSRLPKSPGGKITRTIIENYLNQSNFQIPYDISQEDVFHNIRNQLVKN